MILHWLFWNGSRVECMALVGLHLRGRGGTCRLVKKCCFIHKRSVLLGFLFLLSNKLRLDSEVQLHTYTISLSLSFLLYVTCCYGY